MSEADIATLAHLADAMESGKSRSSYNRFADQDSELHDLIAQGSGNRLVREALAALHTHLHIFRLRFHSEVTTEACAEHALLVSALGRRNPADAEHAMRLHIEKSYARLKAFASDPP
jgi:DNA-binding GntR family transcriptional regulator